MVNTALKFGLAGARLKAAAGVFLKQVFNIFSLDFFGMTEAATVYGVCFLLNIEL